MRLKNALGIALVAALATSGLLGVACAAAGPAPSTSESKRADWPDAGIEGVSWSCFGPQLALRIQYFTGNATTGYSIATPKDDFEQRCKP